MQNLAQIEQNIRIFPGILGVLPIWLILGPTATPASDSAQSPEFDDLRGSHRSHPQAQARPRRPTREWEVRYTTLRSDA